MNIFRLSLIFVSLITLSCGKSGKSKVSLSPSVKKNTINESHAYSARSKVQYQKLISLSYDPSEKQNNRLNLSNSGLDMFLEDPWFHYYDLNSGQQDLGCATLKLVENTPNNRSGYVQIEVRGFQGEFHPIHSLTVYLNNGVMVPGEPLILAEFSEEDEKSLTMELCLQLAGENLPAQPYPGEILLSYYQDPCPAEGCDSEFDCSDNPKPDYRPITCDAKIAASVYQGERVRLPFKIEKNNIHITKQGANSKSKFLGLLAKNMDASDHIFQAPDSHTEVEFLNIMGKNQSGKMVKCLLKLLPEKNPNSLDPYYYGIDMKFYNVADNGEEPDFDELQADVHVKAMELDLPKNHWITGYKGYKSQNDWVGLSLEGELCVPKAGRYNFQFQLDDSGDLFIDNQKVLSLNSPPNQSGAVELDLSQGWHPIKVHYYQGPRYKIDISLQWQLLDTLSPLSPIPHHLLRYSD